MGDSIGAVADQERLVQGALLKQARLAQGLTMEDVLRRGGPSKAFQSEVENGKKDQVSLKLLTKWVRILGVTVAYAQGALPTFHRRPQACCGLAGDVGALVRDQWHSADWVSLSPFDRPRRVLELVRSHSARLPFMALSHVLGIQPQVLDEIIEARMPVPLGVVKALAGITMLPERWLKGADLDSQLDRELMERYMPAIYMAVSRGISPDRLKGEIARW